MAEKSSLLVLRLEGVLQSWGERAKWDDRDSASMPSKSGIVGLLACAMGLEREDPEITANGGKRSPGTIISKRIYLQDASFLVVIAADALWHDRIAAALKAPKWCVYLGRKTCVPSRPVLECEAPEEQDPLKLIRTYPAADRAVYPMTFETDIPLSQAASYTRPDERKPGWRSFERRMVWRGVIEEDSHVSDEN